MNPVPCIVLLLQSSGQRTPKSSEVTLQVWEPLQRVLQLPCELRLPPFFTSFQVPLSALDILQASGASPTPATIGLIKLSLQLLFLPLQCTTVRPSHLLVYKEVLKDL